MRRQALAALARLSAGLTVVPARLETLRRWGFACQRDGVWVVTLEGSTELLDQVRAGRVHDALTGSGVVHVELRTEVQLELARAMVDAPPRGRPIRDLRAATGLADPTIRRGLRALGGYTTGEGRGGRWHLPTPTELVLLAEE